ncbi:O-acetylhomoserine sulfhydrylase [Methylorubrum populi]
MIPTLDSAPDGIATRHDRYPDAQIRAILRETRSIALVGASANPARPSYIVFKYLAERGYAVIPINPGLAGQDLLGHRVIARLPDLTEPVDMVEIFRNSAAAGPLVDEALALPVPPKVIWMQLGVRDDAAAARAEAAGVTVIMNRCPKIEYGRLSGEIGWTGVNSRIISAKKPQMARGGVQKRTIEGP